MKNNNIRVVIIAEIDECIEWVTKWLEMSRYQVIVLPNKFKLIELVSDIKPNIIIAAKELNGIKFCTRLKKTKGLADIPVILMYEDDERFDDVADADWTQSFRRDELLVLIRNLTTRLN